MQSWQDAASESSSVPVGALPALPLAQFPWALVTLGNRQLDAGQAVLMGSHC